MIESLSSDGSRCSILKLRPDAHFATIVGDWVEPSGESQLETGDGFANGAGGPAADDDGRVAQGLPPQQ